MDTVKLGKISPVFFFYLLHKISFIPKSAKTYKRIHFLNNEKINISEEGKETISPCFKVQYTWLLRAE